MKNADELFFAVPFRFRKDAFQMRPQAQYVVRGLTRDFTRVCNSVFLIHDVPCFI